MKNYFLALLFLTAQSLASASVLNLQSGETVQILANTNSVVSCGQGKAAPTIIAKSCQCPKMSYNGRYQVQMSLVSSDGSVKTVVVSELSDFQQCQEIAKTACNN